MKLANYLVVTALLFIGLIIASVIFYIFLQRHLSATIPKEDYACTEDWLVPRPARCTE